MLSRRPYASRGVSRRAPVRRRSAGGAPSPAIAALIGLLGLSAVVALWIGNPFAAGNSSANSVMANLPLADAGGSATSRSEPVNSAAGAEAAPTAAPTARRWAAATPGIDVDADLASRLDQALLGVDGHLGVAVKDLGSGRGAVLDGDLELQAASLYKLPVLYSVFDARLNMREELPITEEALAYDSGTMELGPGETLSVAEALERMVTLSDNTSAIMLAGRLGASRVNASINALGLATTHYSLERMTTSALDMLHFLEVVARGKAVSAGASADMLHLLLRQRVNDRLPRLLPEGVRAAHKTGNLPGTVNDVGIIYGPKSTFAIAALVSDTSDETAAATGIARAALAAMNYFNEQPEVAARPLIPPAPSRDIPPVWREPRPVPTATPVVILPAVVSTVAVATPTFAVLTPTPQPTVAPTATATATTAPTRAPSPTPVPVRPKPPAPTATPVPRPTTAPAPPQPTRAPTRPPAAATPLPPGRR